MSTKRPARLPGQSPFQEPEGPPSGGLGPPRAQRSSVSGWASGAQGRGVRDAPASQGRYLGSLASEASLEDAVGRGPPLLRSLALASEASAGAQKGGCWLGKGRPRGQGQPGRRAQPQPLTSRHTPTPPRP